MGTLRLIWWRKKKNNLRRKLRLIISCKCWLAALSLLKDTRSMLSVSTLSYICMVFITFDTNAGYVKILHKPPTKQRPPEHWGQHKEYQGSLWMHSRFGPSSSECFCRTGKKTFKGGQGCSKALNGFTKWVVGQRSSLLNDIVDVTCLHV